MLTRVEGRTESDLGRLLGSYRLLGEIAVGEFCSIHRARSVHPARPPVDVAIKRLLRAHQHSQGRARLLREARVGLGLRAPNLVRVLEIHDEPELFVVMEHVAGASLRTLLSRAHEVDAMRYIVPIFVDALHGLSVLHNWKDEQGAPGYLVHQAPSARHMLVGLDGVTRLIDMSSVHGRLLGAAADAEDRLVRDDKAPEQVAQGAIIDPRCDIFIVGTALLAALACARDARAAKLGESHVRAQLGALQALCEQACSPTRAARFWSAEEMAYALQKTAREADLYATPQAVGAYVQRVLALPAEPTPALRPPARPCVPPPPPAHAMKHTIDFSTVPRTEAPAIWDAPPSRARPPSPPSPSRARPPSPPSSSRALPPSLPPPNPFASRALPPSPPPLQTTPRQPPLQTTPRQPPLQTTPRQPPLQTTPRQPPLQTTPRQPPLQTTLGPASADARQVELGGRPSLSAIPTTARASSLPSPGLDTTELRLPTTTHQRLRRVGVLAAAAVVASGLIVGVRDAHVASSVAAARAPLPVATVQPASAAPAAREPQALMPLVTSLERLPEPQPVRVIGAAPVVIEAVPAAPPPAAAAAPAEKALLPQPVRPVRRQSALSVHDFADPLPASLSRGLPANPYE
jgi:hypothetical protein